MDKVLVKEESVQVSAGMSAETSGGAPARSPWLWALLLMVTCSVVIALLPATRAWCVEVWSHAESFGGSLLSLFPVKLQPMVAKGATVFLSPWLYLLMAVVFLAEKVIPADRQQRVFSVGMIQDFVGWFVIGGMVRVVLVGAMVAGLYWFCSRFLSGLRIDAVSAWPIVIVSLLAVLAGDLLNWFHHYIRHKIEVFWLFHTIHHSQEQMNMFTDLRVHIVEYAIAKPITILPLFVLGLDVQLAFWLTLVIESYTRIYHSNLRTNYGPLRYLLVTPQSHRIHHSALPQHMDKNFAVIFSFWDRLFGTQWTNYDEYPPTGIGDTGFPHERSVAGLRIVTNYIWQMIYPFKVIWSRVRSRHEAVTPLEPREELR